ncbi:MAG: CD1871A family CXXC motif-containing protein [Angelakisella sp.]|nr:CD1871A family CXXC motif-containing protein [Angelakisella sp.]
MDWIKRNSLAFLVLVLGIVFVVLGVMRGEHDTVLLKAINICLECIGIG